MTASGSVSTPPLSSTTPASIGWPATWSRPTATVSDHRCRRRTMPRPSPCPPRRPLQAPDGRHRTGTHRLEPGPPGADGTASLRRAASRDASGRTAQRIAVIGMSGQFPDADNVEPLLAEPDPRGGRRARTARPLPRPGLYYSPRKQPGKTYCRWGGILAERACFDPLFFNISPREAESMSPHQRLILQESWKSLEDAGYNPKSLADTRSACSSGRNPPATSTNPLPAPPTPSSPHACPITSTSRGRPWWSTPAVPPPVWPCTWPARACAMGSPAWRWPAECSRRSSSTCSSAWPPSICSAPRAVPHLRPCRRRHGLLRGRRHGRPEAARGRRGRRRSHLRRDLRLWRQPGRRQQRHHRPQRLAQEELITLGLPALRHRSRSASAMSRPTAPAPSWATLSRPMPWCAPSAASPTGSTTAPWAAPRPISAIRPPAPG